MNDNEIRVLLPEQAANFLGLSMSTLAKMRLGGDGPTYIKLGARRVGYMKSDLHQWLDNRRHQSTSEY